MRNQEEIELQNRIIYQRNLAGLEELRGYRYLPLFYYCFFESAALWKTLSDS